MRVLGGHMGTFDLTGIPSERGNTPRFHVEVTIEGKYTGPSELVQWRLVGNDRIPRVYTAIEVSNYGSPPAIVNLAVSWPKGKPVRGYTT
jgi:hypothetical protein